jgi:hypothetical protein
MEDKLIKERTGHHGTYSSNARLTLGIIKALKSGYGYDRLTPEQEYGLIMIANKMCRIVSGNPSFKDHWEDIIGYAKLAGDLIEVPEEWIGNDI